MKKQFIKLPDEALKDNNLEMRDKVIYAYLKKHYNQETKDSFPSLDTLVKESGISKSTVIKCIKNLETSGYISVRKDKKVNHYTFSDFKKFEIYSYDFLDDKTLSMSDKAYLVSMQPYMFKEKDSGVGKVTWSEFDIAKILKIDLRTLRKYENHLQQRDHPVLTLVPTAKRDPETGLAIQERIFDFESYNNVLALKFQQIDEELDSKVSKAEYDSTIKNLMNRIKELEKQLNTTEVHPIIL